MVIKKYKLFLGVLLLLSLATTVNAQVGGAGSVYDSSVISKKGMNQQNEFWNGTYNFPAKPRNMWEVGVSGGMFSVSSDVAAKIPTLGFSAHVRKAFGYIFSLRLQYLNGTGKGMNWLASENYGKNPAWNRNLPVGQRYFSPERGNNGVLVYQVSGSISQSVGIGSFTLTNTNLVTYIGAFSIYSNNNGGGIDYVRQYPGQQNDYNTPMNE